MLLLRTRGAQSSVSSVRAVLFVVRGPHTMLHHGWLQDKVPLTKVLAAGRPVSTSCGLPTQGQYKLVFQHQGSRQQPRACLRDMNQTRLRSKIRHSTYSEFKPTLLHNSDDAPNIFPIAAKGIFRPELLSSGSNTARFSWWISQ